MNCGQFAPRCNDCAIALHVGWNDDVAYLVAHRHAQVLHGTYVPVTSESHLCRHVGYSCVEANMLPLAGTPLTFRDMITSCNDEDATR
jgi:hypothetical protein